MMRLLGSDNSELMKVTALKPGPRTLAVKGTIMGTMPIEARVTPTELRQLLKLLNVRIVWHVLRMLFMKDPD